MKSVRFRAMGTDVEIIVENNTLQADRTYSIISCARQRMTLLESRLSRFREDSELSLINVRSGQWVEVSADTLAVLDLANDYFERTNGLFNPFLGHVMNNLGYSVTFKDIDNETKELFRVEYPYLPPIRSPLQLDKTTSHVRLDNGFKLDLGGIAKGWIVEQTADVLLRNDVFNFVCNAGGDIVCKGTNNGAPWVVGITDPFHSHQSIFNLDVFNVSVATSGTYNRKWSYNGRDVHHIIDPFLGEPVQTDIVSCTVVHPSLVEAEVLAKVAIILGSTVGIEFLEKQTDCKWVIVKHTGEVEHSCSL
ncbi:FAD:protein FMN transferase (plasmid) [Alicyclobacillus fastidiosus]|uniref:FAD:protein FMN transferase n=1 Tax=Alicyclobacillus fastidiosus TaxID=392011 RepID=A0ABY6ZQ52_9BACL|nr:FAD:protein FMN transferase [Alicyclobacillus fastidiosus]WAH44949.1 FAD:protein FMN transferase [Alicyclobacillus fastidiosus]GMA65600.1 FAD:protein FMN transferase [Alicyclobacillus fastidiosus]GMA65716.1 FAD:protein FMN transferase [Alicyclobacillus fastidiosus]